MNFRGTSSNRSNSWNRYEYNKCYYQQCKEWKGRNQCAWFYNADNCSQIINNNGRYYDEYFGRANSDYSDRGQDHGGQNNYGYAKLPRNRD